MGTKNLNIPFSEDEFKEWGDLKDEFGMTWKEFTVEGFKALKRAKAKA